MADETKISTVMRIAPSDVVDGEIKQDSEVAFQEAFRQNPDMEYTTYEKLCRRLKRACDPAEWGKLRGHPPVPDETA